MISRNTTSTLKLDPQTREQLGRAGRTPTQTDIAHESGKEIRYQRYPGGCLTGGTAEFKVLDHEGSVQAEYTSKDRLSIEHLSLNGDATMVAAHVKEYQRPEQIIEIPVPGKQGLGGLVDLLRRRGLLPWKRLTEVPCGTSSVDVGPEKQVAIASDDQVLVWQKGSHLSPLARFDRPVTRVEFTASGSLLVETVEEEYWKPAAIPDYYLVNPESGEAVRVQEHEFNPESFARRAERATQDLKMFEGRSQADKVIFAQNPPRDFLDGRHNRALVSADGKRAVTWNTRGEAQLYLYRFADAQLRELGALLPEQRPLQHRRAWTDAEAQLTPDGRFLLLASRADQGEQDAVVWDLEQSRCTYLPSVGRPRIEGDALDFTTERGRLRLALKELESAVHEDWYARGQSRSLQRQTRLETADKVRGVEFLEKASFAEQNLFLKNCSWLGQPGRWQRHRWAGQGQRALVSTSEGLFLYERDNGRAVEMPNRLAARPRLKPEYYNFEPEFNQDASLAVQAFPTASNKGTVDLVVWDLEQRQIHLLPEIREHQVLPEGGLRLRTLDGKSRTLKLEEIGRQEQEEWYQRALLGMAPSAPDVGELELTEDGFYIGDQYVEI